MYDAPLLLKRVADLKLEPGDLDEKAGRIANLILRSQELSGIEQRVSQEKQEISHMSFEDSIIGFSDFWQMLFGDESAQAPPELLSHKNMRGQLDGLLTVLDERERKIIDARFGLNGQKPRTVEEVGKEFGVTRERIRQLQNIALRKLRRPLQKKDNPIPKALRDAGGRRNKHDKAEDIKNAENDKTKAWELPPNRSSFERYLHSISGTFLRTAHILEEALAQLDDVDWSSAVISLCKSLELELVYRLFEPMKASAGEIDLSTDMDQIGIDRIARFCKGAKPPELGSMAFFLGVVQNSKRRRETSPTLKCFCSTLNRWPESYWLIANDGLPNDLKVITTSYRNKAAHTEVLSKDAYVCCREMIIGEAGTLWRTIRSTSSDAMPADEIGLGGYFGSLNDIDLTGGDCANPD